MSKSTKVEITARRKRMQEAVLKSVAKTEQLNIRIDEASITRLYAHASKQGKAVGTMVREWIIERLQAEEDSNNQPSYAVLAEAISRLHKRLDRWEGLVEKAPAKHFEAECSTKTTSAQPKAASKKKNTPGKE